MPKLTDPGELELIRKIYFEDHKPKSVEFDIDSQERWDRLIHGVKIKQAR